MTRTTVRSNDLTGPPKMLDKHPGAEGSSADVCEIVNSSLAEDQVAIAIRAISVDGTGCSVPWLGFHNKTNRGAAFAGDVIAVGVGVRDVRVGDRVMSVGCNLMEHASNEVTGRHRIVSEHAYPLRQVITKVRSEVIGCPDHYSFSEAATLPVSAFLAWIGLFEVRPLRPGQTVLILGTGGAALLALQMAKSAGLRTIVMSADESNALFVERYRADLGISTENVSSASQLILNATSGAGVDAILALDGSMECPIDPQILASGGFLAYAAETPVHVGLNSAVDRLWGQVDLCTSEIDRPETFRRMLNALDYHRIRPAIAHTFQPGDVRLAIDFALASKCFGSTVVLF